MDHCIKFQHGECSMPCEYGNGHKRAKCKRTYAPGKKCEIGDRCCFWHDPKGRAKEGAEYEDGDGEGE